MNKKIAIRDAFGEALVELGEKNEKVVVLDADVSNSTRTIKFEERFPDRFFNVGVAEANMMNIAAGLATCGFIPFASTFSFLACLRAGEQIRTSIAYPELNVKIAAGYAGLSDSYDGTTHQSVCDIAIARSIPNLTVIVVADAQETKIAVPAIAQYKGPVFFRLSRAEVPVIFDKDHQFEIGKANILREGSDVTLIATGVMVVRVLEAADKLENEGVSAGIVEIHTIKPLDERIVLQAAEETKAIVTAEEHSILGGLGSAVAELLVKHYPVPLEMVGILDVFAESGDYEELLDKYGMGVTDIVKAVKAVLERKKRLGKEE